MIGRRHNVTLITRCEKSERCAHAGDQRLRKRPPASATKVEALGMALSDARRRPHILESPLPVQDGRARRPRSGTGEREDQPLLWLLAK